VQSETAVIVAAGHAVGVYVVLEMRPGVHINR
jgi:hypothetical protein